MKYTIQFQRITPVGTELELVNNWINQNQYTLNAYYMSYYVYYVYMPLLLMRIIDADKCYHNVARKDESLRRINMRQASCVNK